MRKRRQIELFSISFLDLLSGALGAVIILYVAIPKNKPTPEIKTDLVEVYLKNELKDSKERVEFLRKELTEAKEKIKSLQASIPIQSSPTPVESIPEQEPTLDAGFKFKGKNIVFAIDTSYSMIEEDRMGQVKAGIKMLLTSLPSTYKVEIIQFPLAERAPFRSMWGTTKDFYGFNRSDSFDFIYALRPSGGTPTRETLLFILENYPGISDIVLLTDGAPTFHNSNTKDDIFEILRLVREKNISKVQINTIGVGTHFLKDKQSQQYKFLSLLSSENRGFFVGF